MSEEEIQKIKEEYYNKGQKDGYQAGYADGREFDKDHYETGKQDTINQIKHAIRKNK